MHADILLAPNSRRFGGGVLRHGLASLFLVLAVWCVAATLDTAGMQQKMVSRFGAARVVLLNNWFQLVAAAQPLGDEEKIKRINDFFNQFIQFESDISVWGQSDYWATPIEFIGIGRGDCEDYSIAKYYSLRLAGVPVNKMRLIYVKANRGNGAEAHMVLAYYSSPTAEPVILDNLEAAIRPASQRPDLTPVFSFNSRGIYSGVGGTEKMSAGGTGRLSRWEDLMRRARAEGFFD
ncbi:MAG: transglutaminase-like cysteine peptidase [Betaproteobacteria bacterium]|nr:transglutaminase-like cysteine peptidase [Betaproteobacteria bacterium]